jgi:hypothetical protein
MAKSFILLLCLCIQQGLRAQDNRIADTNIPQKLELRKASIGWVDHSNYIDYPNSLDHPNFFAKKPDEGDTARSILYLGPPKQDSFDLNLPKMQADHVSFRASAHRPLPLFRIQQ